MPKVAISMPHSCPQIETASAVARTAAAVFTRLLPRRMVDRSLAGRSIILATRPAPFTWVLTRCSTLNRCKEIKAVSELEKKADKRRQTKRNTKYSVSRLDI